jgi:hypothetical protein
MNELDPIADDPTRPGCEAGQAALQRLLDSEAAWDTPDAAAHRATCADCREELALARTFAALPAPVTVPSELATRVHRSVARADRLRRFIRFAGPSVALAASVLVAVFVLQPAPQTITEVRTVARLPEPKQSPQRKLGESVSEARDAIVALTRRTADETRETSSTLIPNPKLGNMPDTGEGLSPLADAQAGAVRSVEPLTSSARRALNLFLRAADPPNKPAAVQ